MYRIAAVVLRSPGIPVTVEQVELDRAEGGRGARARRGGRASAIPTFGLPTGELGEGRWPMVLGHEGAGVVAEVGEGVEHVAPGDHVAFSFVPACGTCRACAAGRPNLCEPAGARASRARCSTERVACPYPTAPRCSTA